MRSISYALLADGSSDRAMLSVIRWTLQRLDSELLQATPGFELRLPKEPLAEAIARCSQRHGPDLLFVHRDAERVPLAQRRLEIPTTSGPVPVVRVVPVRMTEAWLLIDESAIRLASGNPNGCARLALPRVRELERLPDPKKTLHELLLDASEARGRRRAKLRRDLSTAVHRVAQLIDDFSQLAKLPAWQAFERELQDALGAR